MTVSEIYERYRIMPELQLHQLRVAAVGKIICANSMRELDEESVVLAGLFHDMGNIIKSDLATFPEFLEPLGRAHWELVKQEFIGQYGSDEHAATYRIAEEIGLPSRAAALIGGIGFSQLDKTRASKNYEQKIAEYADLRVAPHGVLSMTARIEDARVRYQGKHPDVPDANSEFERLRAAAFDIEQQIFADASIAPDDITEQAAQQLFFELRDLQV